MSSTRKTTDELVAACEKLVAELELAKYEEQRAKLASNAERQRQEYDRHMGWYSGFNPHDLRQLRIKIHGREDFDTELSAEIFATPYAQRISAKTCQQLKKFLGPGDTDARRNIVAAAYEKIAAMASRKNRRRYLWRQLVARMLPGQKFFGLFS